KELEPQERIAFIYEDISWEHTPAFDWVSRDT
ncbi:type VI secretion system tube protein Hcp, partial [Escherichia coli]|nr:type VI secretion system tube protein Hcp [Escherichia coli]